MWWVVEMGVMQDGGGGGGGRLGGWLGWRGGVPGWGRREFGGAWGAGGGRGRFVGEEEKEGGVS